MSTKPIYSGRCRFTLIIWAGQHISGAFLEFKKDFSEVRVVTRDPASPKAQALAAKGAVLYKLDESDLAKSLDKALAGVDAIVDVLSTGYIPAETTHAAIEAGARSTAKVYFLSEWGVDHRVTEFEGYDLPFWQGKRAVAAKARALMPDKKVIGVYTSAFLDLIFRPGPFSWLAVPSDVLDCIESATQPITFNSMVDIGRTAARLALLAVDPATAARVPDGARIASTTASVEDIRDAIARYTGKTGEIRVHPSAMARERLRADPGKDMFMYFGVSAGEGKIDYSKENVNELVNPGQSLWKWRTVEDEIRDICAEKAAA